MQKYTVIFQMKNDLFCTIYKEMTEELRFY